MIELRKLTKSFRTRSGRKYVFRDVDARLPDGVNVAILGRNGAGKSTLMRILGGTDHPDSGEVRTDRSISWPLGLTGGFQGSLSGRENTRFVSRVYGASDDDIRERVDFVHGFSELGDYFDMPVKTYSNGMRARLGFALSMAFQFDVYLVDEITAVGDDAFKKKCTQAFRDLRGRASVIMASHSVQTIRQQCDAGIVVGGGQAMFFERLEDAIRNYQRAA